MSIYEKIQNELTMIEEKENLTILLSVESGSRAWGFASPDSDYDVRFIYIRPREYYLRLDKGRDVCEWLLNDILDINGWDFKKALYLLRLSNATLFEWLSSPIVYRRHPAFAEMMKDTDIYFLPKAGMYHYLRMAERNYREHIKGVLVKLKTYFYVLRPLLACRYILAERTPPPMLFRELVDTRMEPSLVPEIEALMMLKENNVETEMTSLRPLLNAYIEENLIYLKSEAGKLHDERKHPWELFNEMFLRVLTY